MTSPHGDELRAAVAARHDLGPDFEDSIIESFLDKMGKEVDRRVDERMAADAGLAKRELRQQQSVAGMRLSLAIVSIVMGTIATVALTVGESGLLTYMVVWGGVFLVNLAFTFGSPRR
ncbi:hypothetical protein AB0B45_39110 [Nonomuraea sp. NPDC049152]|uniref:hypothetical protein n=1 Tax=Nonomuraea sp. NPDC049152 TaxID=3154350 RepID=UPI003406D0C2